MILLSGVCFEFKSKRVEMIKLKKFVKCQEIELENRHNRGFLTAQDLSSLDHSKVFFFLFFPSMTNISVDWSYLVLTIPTLDLLFRHVYPF